MQIETVTLTWLRCCSCRVRDRLPPPPPLCNWGTVRHADIAYVISGFVSAISNLPLWRSSCDVSNTHRGQLSLILVGGFTTCLAFCTTVSSYITRAFLLLRTRIGWQTARFINSYSVYLFVEKKFPRMKWLTVVFRHLYHIVAADSRVTCILNGYPCTQVGQHSLSFIRSLLMGHGQPVWPMDIKNRIYKVMLATVLCRIICLYVYYLKLQVKLELNSDIAPRFTPM